MKRLALALLFAPALAHAGAFSRPNFIDARAVGMGGAFTAVADDPTAVFFNPAGLTQIQRTTLLGGFDLVAPTFIASPAQCSPGGMTSTSCDKITASTALPLPALAFSTRFAGAGGRDPSRFALGFGMFITRGLQVAFDQEQLTTAGENPGIIRSKFALLELMPSVAYKVNDVLSIGVSLSAGVMGMGLTDFESQTDTRPSDATLSGSGAGFGYVVGVLVKPVPELAIGGMYHSRINVSVSGDGSVSSGGGAAPQTVGFNLNVPWPQSVSFGAAYRVLPGLRIMASYDWTDWGSFDAIAPHFSDANLDKLGRVLLDYSDSYTIHAGAEYAIGAEQKVVVRAGLTYDTNAIPDRTLDRQLIDGPKNTIDGGGSVRLGDHVWLDAAGDYVFGAPRPIAKSDMSVPKYLQNVAPGSYEATVISVLLAGRYQF